MNSHPVDVWTVALDAPRPSLLSPEEHARALRFHFERDRTQWTHCRSALRAVLSGYVNEDAQAIRFAIGPHGKPALEVPRGIEFNVSHSGGRAMIAVSRDIPVGIDLELIRETVDIAKLLLRIGERDLPESKADLFHAWTRREARTKALGGPLMEMPSGDLRVVDLDAPAGFAASLALLGFDARITYRPERQPRPGM